VGAVGAVGAVAEVEIAFGDVFLLLLVILHYQSIVRRIVVWLVSILFYFRLRHDMEGMMGSGFGGCGGCGGCGG